MKGMMEFLLQFDSKFTSTLSHRWTSKLLYTRGLKLWNQKLDLYVQIFQRILVPSLCEQIQVQLKSIESPRFAFSCTRAMPDFMHVLYYFMLMAVYILYKLRVPLNNLLWLPCWKKVWWLGQMLIFYISKVARRIFIHFVKISTKSWNHINQLLCKTMWQVSSYRWLKECYFLTYLTCNHNIFCFTNRRTIWNRSNSLRRQINVFCSWIRILLFCLDYTGSSCNYSTCIDVCTRTRWCG